MAYNYSYLFPFEKTFDPVPSTVWMQNNWGHSITLSALYSFVIYFGQQQMSSRKPCDLKTFLFLWNASLALFSICGAIRFAPEFFYVLNNYGFQYSICVTSYAQGVTGFWTELFAASKVLELVDTAFIVLRKRKVTFLHCFHHITVLMYTWHAYKDHTSAGRWFIMMNYAVHGFMYSYYSLRTANFWFHKLIPMTITTMQTAQMVIGMVIGVMAFVFKNRGEPCQQTYANLYFSFAIYCSYFVLFSRFFYYAYLHPAERIKYINGAIGKNNKRDYVLKNEIFFEGKKESTTQDEKPRITQQRSSEIPVVQRRIITRSISKMNGHAS